MKKLLLGLIAAIGLISSSLTFAEAQPTTGYSSMQMPRAKLSAAAMVFPTNIVIINESDYKLFAVVPNTPINQLIASGGTGLITHTSYSGNTDIKIFDSNNRDLFGTVNVCHRAIITVSDGPSVYHMNVEPKFC